MEAARALLKRIQGLRQEKVERGTNRFACNRMKQAKRNAKGAGEASENKSIKHIKLINQLVLGSIPI